MTAQRSTFDHEPDVLEGRSIEQAKAEAGRLAGKALELTIYLARPHAGLTSIVRANLEAERDRYEWESAGIESRIAEHEGKIVKLRELPVPLSPRARRQRREAV